MELNIGQFTEMITQRLSGKEKEKYLRFQQNKTGYLADYSPDWQLERRYAARIVHEVLEMVLGEEAESDLSCAFELKDIYECKVCTGHIAEIYAKGIMDAHDRLFDVRNTVTSEEAEVILERLFDKEKRLIRESEEKSPGVRLITQPVLKELLKKDRNILLVDIRPDYESKQYPPEIDGLLEERDRKAKIKFINIPGISLIRNPYLIKEYSNVFDDPLLLYGEHVLCFECAYCLIDAGYRSVYSFE